MNTTSIFPYSKKLSYPFLALSMTAFLACSKENNNENAITEEEAAEVVVQAVAPESGGIAAQMESAAKVSNNVSYLSYCGLQKDSTIAGASVSGAAVSWAYNFNWNWLLSCNEGSADKFELTFTGTSSYDGPRMSATHNSNAAITVTGLGYSSTAYTINETLVRLGTHTSKIRRQITFTSEATFNAVNVKVDKLTRKIVSGTASLTIEGTTSAGRTFSYEGTLTFNGNNKGTLVLNSGHSFLIQW